MRNGRLIILIICTLITSCTFAQQHLNYLFRHITQADGLLHNQVPGIAQDKKGFIWIATSNGLQRYDGLRFNYYPEMLSNAAGELTNGAEIYADNKNNLLWISKNNLIEKMTQDKNSVTVYDAGELLNDTTFHFTAYSGANNSNWMLGNNAAYFHINTPAKKDYQWNTSQPDAHRASYIFSDSINKQTWVATMGSVFLFNEKNKTVYSHDPGIHPLLQDSLYGEGDRLSRFVLVDSRNNVWVTTWGDRLYRYDPLTKKVSTYFLSAVKSIQQGSKASPAGLLINCMLEDDHNNIWLATENAGLLRYNRANDDFDYCITREKNSEGIRYNYKILTLFQDREQNIWVGTDKGISIFSPYRQYFKAIRHEENEPLSISKSEIISFIQTTTGDIFIGTWGGGMAAYDKTFHFKKNILFKNPYQNNFIWSFLQFDDKTLWIGCQHGYLQIYDIVSGKTQSILPPEMEGSTIRCMEKDANGNVWFGLHNGKIVKWDKQQRQFLPFSNSLKNLATVLNIFIDHEQNCWVSTEGGFKQFDLQKMEYTNTWLPNKNDMTSLSGKTCEGIEEYSDSVLLIGTIYGGLNFFNKRTQAFSHLSIADGLPSNSIYAIKKDTAGYVWFTTDFGLYKFNLADKKIIPYSMSPGLINSSIISNRFYPLQDGQWLIFTTTEAVSFFPGKTEFQENLQPKVEITGFNLFDKPLSIDSLLSVNKTIRLSHKENFFTIEFAALNFWSLQQIHYDFRLHGIDKDWVHGGTRRFANYTDLQPGEYTFDVKAENGTSGGEITSFKIIIAPPIWQTWWFRCLCILVIVIVAYSLVRKRIKMIRHEAAMKQKIAETEMMALRAQMNPHFIFNCLNSIDNLIQTDQKEKATDYLAKFAQLIRDILENSKNNIIPCWKDVEALKLYLEMEELRWDKKIECDINIAPEIHDGDYKVPPMILQPFVENAIHHGLLNKIASDKKLAIEVKLEGSKIKYTIRDNGVGRLKAGEYKKLNRSSGKPFGMQITKDRINLFNQDNNGSVKITDLYDEFQQPEGTLVEVWLTTQLNPT